MSVVVKGLNLENKHLDGYVDVRIHYCDGNIYATIPTGERPYYEILEVVELPDKHGRLGDLDALIRDHFSPEHRIALSETNKAWMRRIINDSPTIVEAEDSELAKGRRRFWRPDQQGSGTDGTDDEM